MILTDRIASYVRGALAREVDALHSAVEGGRNDTAFRAAAKIGQLVQADGLDYAEVEAALFDAVAAWEPAEAAKGRATIRRGLAEGMKTPRDLGTLANRRASPRPAPRPAPAPAPPPSRPPLADVKALWNAGLAVTSKGAEPVAALLRRRGLDPATVEDFDLMRALSPTGALPPWAAIGSCSWRDSGHLALLPAFDATGALVTIRARSVRADATAKEISPQGYLAKGTVYADPLGRKILCDGGAPDWIAAERLRIVIAEGGIDFATWATHFSDADEDAPAVFGIYAGGWTKEIADRVPTGATVAAWSDHDEAGDRYFSKIAETLAGRIRLLRSRREHHVAD